MSTRVWRKANPPKRCSSRSKEALAAWPISDRPALSTPGRRLTALRSIRRSTKPLRRQGRTTTTTMQPNSQVSSHAILKRASEHLKSAVLPYPR